MSLARVVSSVSKTVAKPVNEAGVSGGVPGFDFIGANALAAYDIAPLKTGVTRCFRVRRSSDNTEQDCLSVAEAVTFCGAGSGFITTLYDQNGSSNLTQATSTQQPRIVNAGVSDAAAVLDGSNDFLTRGARLTSGSVTALTVCAWIRTTTTGNSMIAFEGTASTNARQWYIGTSAIMPGRLVAGIFANGGASTNYRVAAGNATINDGNWHHVAVTFDAGTLRLYVNGLLQTLTNILADGTVPSLHSGLGHFSIGCLDAAATPGTFFPGSIRDVRVYSVVKSASEIAAIYASVTP